VPRLPNPAATGTSGHEAGLGTRPPWWITALDILCLVLLALALLAMIGPGVRVSFHQLRISLVSWPRLLLWVGVVLLVRHWAWRAIAWHTRVLGWIRSWFANESWRAAWPPFVASRLVVTVVAYAAVAIIGFNPGRPWRALENDVLDLYARWDTGWYFGIASVGYHANSSFDPTKTDAIAFFPGLPMLMRLVAFCLNVNRIGAGIIIVVVAFFWGLTYVYRLAREDMPAENARAALLFLAFYPFAVCYSAVLTEALFLVTAAGTFFHFRRGQLVKAGAFGLCAGLVRPNGFLLAVPLGLAALLPFARARGWLPWRSPAEDGPTQWVPLAATLGTASLPIVGMLAYSAYVYSLTGDPFAWAKAQQAWGRSPAAIVRLISERTELISTQGWGAYGRFHPVEALEGAAAVFALIAVWPITRRFGLPYAAFVAMAVLPPLITMGTISLGRYTAPLFPIFLWLGAAVPASRRPYWTAAFAAGQALVATLFFTWRPPY
jgi:hypothetical protein